LVLKLYVKIGDVKMRNKMIAVTLICVLLSGCAGMSRNETTGAALGGITGAVIGGSSGSGLGAGIGAAGGAILGGAIGGSVDHY
jgi:osmotically inducible lipoprotein OsmB